MKICVATGTRAEYGLLRPLMTAIKQEVTWELQIICTGAHLSPEFGLTYLQIEEDGFVINKKVEMLLSADTPTSIIKTMGLGMIGYADALDELSPDLLLLLGDRYEMLSIATAALILKIPIAHLHGGEITEGAYDDAIRHAISKISHLHFTSTEIYRNRVIQMGEQPGAVFNVGAIGLDNIKNLKLLSRKELETILHFKFKEFNYQVTFHPATLESESPERQFEVLLRAIGQFKESFFIFTKSNADTGGRVINQMIDNYVAQNPNHSIAFNSLGSLKFLSILNECNAIIGNSSSGIIEAPSLKTAAINIGHRQAGRIQAKSTFNVGVEASEIASAISKTQSSEFAKELLDVINPYGTGNTTQKIMDILKSVDMKAFTTKKFYHLQ